MKQVCEGWIESVAEQTTEVQVCVKRYIRQYSSVSSLGEFHLICLCVPVFAWQVYLL